jgi:hypothetical protein
VGRRPWYYYNSITTPVLTSLINVGRIFGKRWERYGISLAKSIGMGDCVVTNVPVALADISDMNPDAPAAATGTHISIVNRLPHVNGLLGVREMNKFGMIIDCARQMLYITPNGPSAAVSQRLASFLSGRGFTRIPMRQSPRSPGCAQWPSHATDRGP